MAGCSQEQGDVCQQCALGGRQAEVAAMWTQRGPEVQCKGGWCKCKSNSTCCPAVTENHREGERVVGCVLLPLPKQQGYQEQDLWFRVCAVPGCKG